MKLFEKIYKKVSKNGFSVCDKDIALFGGGETWTPASTTHGADKHKKSLTELDSYAKERWDCLLSYLARGTGKVRLGLNFYFVKLK